MFAKCLYSCCEVFVKRLSSVCKHVWTCIKQFCNVKLLFVKLVYYYYFVLLLLLRLLLLQLLLLRLRLRCSLSRASSSLSSAETNTTSETHYKHKSLHTTLQHRTKHIKFHKKKKQTLQTTKTPYTRLHILDTLLK